MTVDQPSSKLERTLSTERTPEPTTEKSAEKPVEKANEKSAAAANAPHIALIVPTGSKAFGKVAEAVKAGFLAGASADGKNAPAYRLYPTDDESAALAAQYRKAVAAGAAIVVGGITRDGANVMAAESRLVPALALNAPASADADLPDRFFYLTLSLDWEARLTARTANGDGLRRVAVVTSNAALGKRVQDSFEKEWIKLGGEVVAQFSVANVSIGDSVAGAKIAAAMDKAFADCVFIATDMDGARAARPYLPQGMPVYATSMTIHPRAQAVDNLDLEHVRFMEMPWFAQGDHMAVMAYTKPAEPLAVDIERLYALGIDAWRLSQMVAKHAKARDIPVLDGVTGRLSLDGRQFVRTPLSLELRNGKPSLFRNGE